MVANRLFVYPIVAWMFLNIVIIVLLLLGGDTADLNNYIEIGLWASSIVGVLSFRKWGFAFALFSLSYTLSTSVGIIIYYGIWANAIRVAINIPIILYLFRIIFEGKTK